MKLFVLLVTFITISGCTYNDSEKAIPYQIDSGNPISYSEDIFPIVSTYCFGTGNIQCHVIHGNQNAIGDFTEYEGLFVKVNDSSISHVLFGQIPLMPPANFLQLPDSDLEKFKLWVAQGAWNN